jgi:succinoglycan biosynthesis protein ExoW
MNKKYQVAVVIPHYQKKDGLLSKALCSVFNQTFMGDILAIVVDDGSPSPALDEILKYPDLPIENIKVITQKNAGAGAARNTALNHVPRETRLVCFLDSDDCWRSHHIESACQALSNEQYDAYFADWWSYNFPEQTNFERIGSLNPLKHHLASGTESNLYELGVSPLEHILSDGGGVIQTSTVVYRYDRFPDLRFREEFYNGQDFFFWMDLGLRGARFVFSTNTDCENGEGINIYQSAGWGTERSLQRIRNELFVWTSVERFYELKSELVLANRKTIRNLQKGAVRDVLYRLRRRRPISLKLLFDIARFNPKFILIALILPWQIIWNFVLNKFR